MELEGQGIAAANTWLLDAAVEGSNLGAIVLETDAGVVLRTQERDFRLEFVCEPSQGAPRAVAPRSRTRIREFDWVERGSGHRNPVRIEYFDEDQDADTPAASEVVFTAVTAGEFVASVAARTVRLTPVVVALEAEGWAREEVGVEGAFVQLPSIRGFAIAVTGAGETRRSHVAVSLDDDNALLVADGEFLSWWFRDEGAPLPSSDLVSGLQLFTADREARSRALMLEVTSGVGDFLPVRVVKDGDEITVTLFAPYACCG